MSSDCDENEISLDDEDQDLNETTTGNQHYGSKKGSMGDGNKNEFNEEKKRNLISQKDNNMLSPSRKSDGVISEPLQLSESNENNMSKQDNSLQQRLLRLKMKMNQSRTLNRKEVFNEAERLGSEEAKKLERKRLQMEDKKRREKEWEECHKDALSTASNMKEAKLLVQHASESIRNTSKKEAKAKENRFDVDDYYNPEGQFRHYQRNLRSISNRNTENSSSDTYDPLSCQNDETQKAITKKGVKMLAEEMKRRADKKMNKKRKLAFSGEDVSYVNKRNKRFNEKISRNFDKYTAEIRQNLERGTAL